MLQSFQRFCAPALLAASALFLSSFPASALAQSALRSDTSAPSNRQAPPDLLLERAGQADPFARRMPAVRRSRAIRIDFERLAKIEAGDVLRLQMFDDVRLDARFQKRVAIDCREGAYHWYGSLRDLPGSQFILTVVDDGVCAWFHTADRRPYELTIQGAPGMHCVREIDASRQTCGTDSHGEGWAHTHTQGPLGLSCDDSLLECDVMVVYDRVAESQAGGASKVSAAAFNGVAVATQVSLNSTLSLRFAPRAVERVSYSGGSSMDVELGRLRSKTDGYMDEVHTWRKTRVRGIDLVMLLVGDLSAHGTVAGIAYRPRRDSELHASNGFSVSEWNAGALTMTHEFGHNFGCHHDDANSQGATLIRSYARGFKWFNIRSAGVTVMGYPDTFHPRQPVFSTTRVAIGGTTVGDAAHQNRQVFIATSQAVANYSLDIGTDPDWLLRSLTASTTDWRENDTITVSGVVANNGGVQAPASTVGIYLSKTGQKSGPRLASISVPALCFPKSHTFSASVRLPASLPPGECSLVAVVDDAEVIAELSEANNTRTLRGNCLAPDLSVRNLIPSTAIWRRGTQMRVHFERRNIGTLAAPTSQCALYLSKDSTIDSSDLLLTTIALSALDAGKSSMVSQTVTMPAPPHDGTCYLGAWIDPSDAIEEINENNNTASYQGSCIQDADLVVTSAKIVSTQNRAGQALRVLFTVKNVGGTVAPASSAALVFAPGRIVALATDAYLGDFDVPSIGVDESKQLDVTAYLPYYARGDATAACTIGVFADVRSDVIEVSETNNSGTIHARCSEHTGQPKLEFRPTVNGAARRTTVASFGLAAGVRSARMALTAPSFQDHYYLCYWSASARGGDFDALSDFSLALLNSAVMPAWFGKLDATGRPQGEIALALPPVAIPGRIVARTHTALFAPDFSRLVAFVGHVVNILEP